MFRNNYDNDSVTFSPQGRIFQVEYASEAVKQGSVVVGIVSKTHAVLVAVKVSYIISYPSTTFPDTGTDNTIQRSIALYLDLHTFTLTITTGLQTQTNQSPTQRNAEELSSYQKKVIAIDEHVGLALAGLASDARVLSNFMKNQTLASRMTYDRAIPIERLVAAIGDRAQTNTQNYGKRPYGVGLLVAGVDETGPHLFEFQPSGMTQEMIACAIGARSQMARTYLERHLEEFPECGREELVKHGLRALKESLAQDKELTVENTSVGVVGIKGEGEKRIQAFKLFDGQDVKQWVDLVADGVEAEAEAGATQTGDATESMEIDDA
ncbi:hypothetical protein DSL72_004520 [Monilinia vaccinii-corymbosi]|uniref:Proteasome alpha-type subunits domain-containing protein n=1 Tax=Monilinia vaccinii-corymbosi TaxID=61207 RepID=A0A8A3NZG8_9HELO|nr:hypothetical protein DSL72_004520 [Monilinia vaccinii-corymbosi]